MVFRTRDLKDWVPALPGLAKSRRTQTRSPLILVTVGTDYTKTGLHSGFVVILPWVYRSDFKTRFSIFAKVRGFRQQRCLALPSWHVLPWRPAEISMWLFQKMGVRFLGVLLRALLFFCGLYWGR